MSRRLRRTCVRHVGVTEDAKSQFDAWSDGAPASSWALTCRRWARRRCRIESRSCAVLLTPTASTTAAPARAAASRAAATESRPDTEKKWISTARVFSTMKSTSATPSTVAAATAAHAPLIRVWRSPAAGLAERARRRALLPFGGDCSATTGTSAAVGTGSLDALRSGSVTSAAPLLDVRTTAFGVPWL